MEHSELLSEFRKKVDEFLKCRSFIDKANEQASKFEASVIEKVVASHTGKSNGIVEHLIPLTADIEAQKLALQTERSGMLEGQTDARNELQELELRQVIGELTKKQFDSQSKGLKQTLEDVDAKVAELDETAAAFQTELDRWNEAAEKAGVIPAGDTELSDLDEDSLVEVGEAEEGVHAESVSVVDDLSVVFDEDEEGVDLIDMDDHELIEVGSENDVLEMDTIDEVIAVDADDEVIEAEEPDIDILADDEDDSLEIEEAGIEAEDVNGTGRRAVLLHLEGTADEQVHPINTEVLSLGRGRDNDIQVKNDSKVSRYHCKIYSRGPNYYIEDNKSANGSLVNGELITERRLFGGEEVIIGETFYRFRILD